MKVRSIEIELFRFSNLFCCKEPCVADNLLGICSNDIKVGCGNVIKKVKGQAPGVSGR